MSESLSGLPEWLSSVPMDLPEQTPVFVGENGEYVSAELLMTALGVEIGTGIGAFSMNPALAQRAAELTENRDWKNLAPEPTLVTRRDEDTWEVMVGDFQGNFDRESIINALTTALQESVEKEN